MRFRFRNGCVDRRRAQPVPRRDTARCAACRRNRSHGEAGSPPPGVGEYRLVCAFTKCNAVANWRDALLRVQDERKVVPRQTYFSPPNSGAGKVQPCHLAE